MPKKKRFLVLEIADNIVKVAMTENFNGRTVITNISNLPGEEGEIGQRIKKLKGYRRYRKNTIILIPPKKVTIRYLELPSRDRLELKEMINFQLPRYLPYALSDIIFDFRIVEETKEGYAKVMVVCIQLQALKDILKKVPYLEDSLYGVFLSGETGIDILPVSVKNKKEVQALVDISFEEVTLSVFNLSGFLFARSLNSAFFNRQENWPKGLEEIERTFMAFSRDFGGRKIESMVITGAKASTRTFYHFLKEHSSQAIELFNPFEHIQLPKDIENRVSGETNLSFQAVIGAGMERVERRINLIPPEILSRKKRQFKKRSRFVILLLVMIIAGQLAFTIYNEIAKRKVYLTRLLDEIKVTQSKAREIEDRQKKTGLIKAQLDMEGSVLEILREVYQIMPAGISLNSFIFEKGNSLSLRGTARTMSEVFSLIPLLEKSPYFEKVLSEGTKMRKIKGEEAADFQIRALLKKNKK